MPIRSAAETCARSRGGFSPFADKANVRTLIRKTSLSSDRSDGTRSSNADTTPTRSRRPRHSSRVTRFVDARSSASSMTLSHERCSERSYLFTISDITRTAAASIAMSARRREFVFSADEQNRPAGGANRIRTDDLMLAKHALSQLSYGPFRGQRTDDRGQKACFPPSAVCSPSSDNWWAWEDLNFRPHAYQARALTN
jgi:hypothetical protein